MESIQLGVPAESGEVDNNTGAANAPGAGERSAPLSERPEWVPEKFFKDGVIDYKGITASYTELEKKQGSKSSEGVEGKTNDAPKLDATPPASIPGVAAERTAHFSEEIKSAGKLSDASYDELAKLGYPKPVVDAYVRGLGADQEIAAVGIANKQIEEIVTSVGGADKLGDMLQWAKNTWTPADLKVYDDAVSSKDVSKVKMAVAGLKAAYVDANGSQPSYLNLGGNSRPANGTGVEPFASEDDVASAMANPKYHSSEEYRQKVYARLRVSKVFPNSRDVTKVRRS